MRWKNGGVSPPLIWTFSPSVIVGVGAACVAYMWAWRRARLPGMPHPPSYGRLALFCASMLCILAALVSPIDALATDVMFVHMIQHVLLLDVVPILLILSLTKGLLRPVTRRLTIVEDRAGFLAHPAFAAFLYIGMMGLWHVPRLYDLALAHGDIHVLEHVCFLTAGTLYWWQLLSPIRARMALTGMGAIVYMAVTKFFVGVLGIVLAFSTHSLYPWYQDHPHYWGMSARVDQNVAGVLMALEQSLIMGTALVYIVYRMLNDSEKDAQRQERYDDAWASYRKQLAERRAEKA
jgi:putative membrane protein